MSDRPQPKTDRHTLNQPIRFTSALFRRGWASSSCTWTHTRRNFAYLVYLDLHKIWILFILFHSILSHAHRSKFCLHCIMCICMDLAIHEQNIPKYDGSVSLRHIRALQEPRRSVAIYHRIIFFSQPPVVGICASMATVRRPVLVPWLQHILFVLDVWTEL